MSWTLLQDVSHTRAGFWAVPDSVSLQMKNPVVQTSLPSLARNLEGLQKMQVSGGVGSGGAFSAHGVVLTLLWPTEEQHSGRAARSRGTGIVAHAELHRAVTRSFGGEFMLGCGSGATGTTLKGTSRFLNLSHLPVPQAKLGKSVQFLSRLAPHLKVLMHLFQPQKTCGVPWTPSAKKNLLHGDGGARKNANQENRSPLVIRFAVANQKSPCKGVFLLRAHASFPALRQPDSIWSSLHLPGTHPAAPGPKDALLSLCFLRSG